MFFVHNEQTKEVFTIDLFLDQLQFNDQGLIPVVVQDYMSHSVLMMAWMNKESIIKTLKEKQMCYWSRSRQKLWVKGEQSGHFQQLIALHADCDGDALLAKVEQQGVACHTLRTTCFYWNINSDSAKIDE